MWCMKCEQVKVFWAHQNTIYIDTTRVILQRRARIAKSDVCPYCVFAPRRTDPKRRHWQHFRRTFRMVIRICQAYTLVKFAASLLLCYALRLKNDVMAMWWWCWWWWANCGGKLYKMERSIVIIAENIYNFHCYITNCTIHLPSTKANTKTLLILVSKSNFPFL